MRMSPSRRRHEADPVTPVEERLAAMLADRCRSERELGAGGMATVYLAHDLRQERRVAIKVLRPELSAGERRRGRSSVEGAGPMSVGYYSTRCNTCYCIISGL